LMPAASGMVERGQPNCSVRGEAVVEEATAWPADPPSPCIAICRLDPGTRICEGCGRLAREIARWPFAEREEKLAILAAIAARRSAAG
jgi:uncharacterized protein